jgi:hypothetical protein
LTLLNSETPPPPRFAEPSLPPSAGGALTEGNGRLPAAFGAAVPLDALDALDAAGLFLRFDACLLFPTKTLARWLDLLRSARPLLAITSVALASIALPQSILGNAVWLGLASMAAGEVESVKSRLIASCPAQATGC